MTKPVAPRIATACGHVVFVGRPIKNGLCPACTLLEDLFESCDLIDDFFAESSIKRNSKGGSS